MSSHKTTFNPPFLFLKCSAPIREYGSCYVIVRFYVCFIVVCFLLHFSVLMFCVFFLIVDVFPPASVCNPDLFSLNRFMTLEHRYTAVAFFIFITTIQLKNRKWYNQGKIFGKHLNKYIPPVLNTYLKLAISIPQITYIFFSRFDIFIVILKETVAFFLDLKNNISK